ncbi:hypothetical protein I204_00606 [Kwoniella mangroviensis CBS 8886]|uniref:uncharacterized protein n=1 Tax=Kwoniella mangroviensis CBS 8507 TaxID=1296122 RepID=UPI00080CDD5D|nr:uncharacterized protein I203_07146 [Kwoniella mangroviensis CBS 8507]OCF63825.1 hypothetical protein I203_07146 [Kwoniella mangroviensis CBS 8507]OCF78664.1 hypothetical protein I204_00606 [Kwoniella mangroviensis CBS 8886]
MESYRRIVRTHGNASFTIHDKTRLCVQAAEMIPLNVGDMFELGCLLRHLFNQYPLLRGYYWSKTGGKDTTHGMKIFLETKADRLLAKGGVVYNTLVAHHFDPTVLCYPVGRNDDGKATPRYITIQACVAVMEWSIRYKEELDNAAKDNRLPKLVWSVKGKAEDLDNVVLLPHHMHKYVTLQLYPSFSKMPVAKKNQHFSLVLQDLNNLVIWDSDRTNRKKVMVEFYPVGIPGDSNSTQHPVIVWRHMNTLVDPSQYNPSTSFGKFDRSAQPDWESLLCTEYKKAIKSRITRVNKLEQGLQSSTSSQPPASNQIANIPGHPVPPVSPAPFASSSTWKPGKTAKVAAPPRETTPEALHEVPLNADTTDTPRKTDRKGKGKMIDSPSDENDTCSDRKGKGKMVDPLVKPGRRLRSSLSGLRGIDIPFEQPDPTTTANSMTNPIEIPDSDDEQPGPSKKRKFRKPLMILDSDDDGD